MGRLCITGQHEKLNGVKPDSFYESVMLLSRSVEQLNQHHDYSIEYQYYFCIFLVTMLWLAIICHSYNNNTMIMSYYAKKYFTGQKKERKAVPRRQNWNHYWLITVYVLSARINFKHSIYNLKWVFMSFSAEFYLGDLRYFV